MRSLRRLLQVVAIVGTLMVGILAVALIVSQTPWFRNWLRKYIVRESKQYLNGDLSIGKLGGNLLFGVDLGDVAVDLSGDRIISVKSLEMDYSIFELISKGMVLDDIKLNEPVVRLERDATGKWNVLQLVKKERQEAERKGPMRPVSLQSIEISDASVTIDDRLAGDGFRLPRQVDDLDVKAGFAYAPVHYTIDVGHASFRSSSPHLALQELTGKMAVRNDNLYVDQLRLSTAESALTVDGVIEQYLSTPIVKLTTNGQVSLPEIGKVVPAAAGYALHPTINLRAEGPAERLGLTLDVTSEAGGVRGDLTADVKAPNFSVRGDVDVNRLDLAPILKKPAQRSDLTGHAKLDLRIASAPGGAPVADRMTGTYSFTGPRVVAAGYEARDVRVNGSLAGPRINLVGRATAYGGTATAQGFIVTPAPGRAVSFDLRGRADNVDLRGLPASTGAPDLATTLSVAAYHVRGEGRAVSGTATLNKSTIEGATVSSGTTAEFAFNGPGRVSYSSRGSVAGLNLQRIGRALRIPALARPEYESRINGRFDVAGSGTKIETMTLDASGALADSAVMGGRLPALDFEAHVAGGGLKLRADGRFEDFDPARLSGRHSLAGRVTGTVNASAEVARLSGPITPEAINADGKVTLTQSSVGGLDLDTATVDGAFARQVGDIRQLHVEGRDLKADASGRLALDRSSGSNLKYHAEAVDLAAIGRLAGQQAVGGSAVVDGTVTGNAGSLRASGTIDGSNLSYKNNKALDLNSKYTLTVPNLEFANARVEANTSATFVSVGGLEINELTAKTTYEQKTIGFTTNIKERTRELDASGQVILHPDHQEIHLPQLAIRTQGIEWSTPAGSQTAVEYGAGRIELRDVRLVSGAQSIEASGVFSLDGKTPAGSLQAHVRNVDLKQLETLTLQDRGLTGTLNADATVSGTSAAPVVAGRFEVANGGFRTYRYDSLKATVDYGGPQVKIDATLQQSPTEFITAKGMVPTTLFMPNPDRGEHVAASGTDRVDLKIKSSALNLGFVQGFTSQVANVSGTLEADVRITGSGRDPHLDGYVDIKNGAFGIPAGGESYRGLTTRIELDPDRMRIQKFQLLDDHGDAINVSGELAVHSRRLGDVNVSIDSDNFEVIDNELGKMRIDSNLKLTGEIRRPRLVGEIRPESGRLEVDQLLQLFYNPYSTEAMPDVVSAEQTVETGGSAHDATNQALQKAKESAAPGGAGQPTGSETPASSGAFAPVALDVRLRIPDNLVLRGKNLRPGGPTGASLGNMNITIGGDMHIRKEAGGQLALTGTVNTVRGTYEFQGRRFDLERDGTLRFTGSPQINPLLDVSATRQIPNTGVTARVHITGTARTPQLALSSTPPLDEADILALIVFNRPVNELGTGERSSLAATAGGIATGFIAAPLGESIGKALDLDIFEISTSTESGQPGAGVTVGQQIGDKAFIKLRQEFGDRNVSEFLLEYRLADFLRLRASAAPETSGAANRIGQRRVERGGLDLLFFFSY
jgi:autotransporter translocation and assembly factor TamB